MRAREYKDRQTDREGLTLQVMDKHEVKGVHRQMDRQADRQMDGKMDR